MTTDDEVNAYLSRKTGRAARRARKVYDLDATPAATELDIVLAACTLYRHATRPSEESQRGVVLCGYDNVVDAIAEISAVPEKAPSGSAAMLPATIELPSKPLMAGENAHGTVRLLQPSPVDTVVNMRSSNPAIAGVPECVVVPAGERSAQFPIDTSNPGRASARVLIQALLPEETLFARPISIRYNLGMKVR